MWRSTSRVRLLVALALWSGTACTPSETPPLLEALVFPREARLGSTAAIAIDSNYLQLGDDLERYDLRKDRVRILLEDDFGARVEASLRQIVDLGAPGWSRYGATRTGAWFQIALFDLPTSGLSFSGTPQIATVIVEVDGLDDPNRVGRIEITGSGGTPTEIAIPTSTGEAELESAPLMRLRAVRADGGNPGFQDAWLIGGIEFDVQWLVCMKKPRVYADSNAEGATAFTGPVVGGDPWFNKTHVVLVDPEGFKLNRPNNFFGLASPTSAGQGPFITMAFDRTGGPVICNLMDEDVFKIENLYVTDVNGEVLIDRRGQGDSTDLVEVITVDTDAQI